MADAAPIDEAGGGGSRTPTPVDLREDIAGQIVEVRGCECVRPIKKNANGNNCNDYTRFIIV